MMITFHNLPTTTTSMEPKLADLTAEPQPTKTDISLPAAPSRQTATKPQAKKVTTNALTHDSNTLFATEKKLKLRFAQTHICKSIQKFCRVCDEAPETFHEMQSLASKGLMGPGNTQNLSGALKQMVQCLDNKLDWSLISVSLVDLLLSALALISKGFANNCFVHSVTATRLFAVYLLLAFDQIREVDDCHSSVLAKCISGVIGLKAHKLSSLAFAVAVKVDFDLHVPYDSYQKSVKRIEKDVLSARQVSNKVPAADVESSQQKPVYAGLSQGQRERASSQGKCATAVGSDLQAVAHSLSGGKERHYLLLCSPGQASTKQRVGRRESMVTATNTMDTTSTVQDDQFSPRLSVSD